MILNHERLLYWSFGQKLRFDNVYNIRRINTKFNHYESLCTFFIAEAHKLHVHTTHRCCVPSARGGRLACFDTKDLCVCNILVIGRFISVHSNLTCAVFFFCSCCRSEWTLFWGAGCQSLLLQSGQVSGVRPRRAGLTDGNLHRLPGCT